MNWSEVDDATVSKLFVEDGLSYRQISKMFFGATLNAVAGRCHRLGLKRGAGQRSNKGRERATQAQKVRVEPKVQGVMTLMELDAQACRFPYGDPRAKDFGFCGMTRKGESPYCAEHARIARATTYKG